LLRPLSDVLFLDASLLQNSYRAFRAVAGLVARFLAVLPVGSDVVARGGIRCSGNGSLKR